MAVSLTRIEEIHDGHEGSISNGEDDVCRPIDTVDEHGGNHDNEKVLYFKSAVVDSFRRGFSSPRANEQKPKWKFLWFSPREVESLVRIPKARHLSYHRR